MNIKNNTVKRDIKRFRKRFKNSDITPQELDLLVKKDFIYNQKYRFKKIRDNYYFDRFQKKYYFYTKPKNPKKTYKRKPMYVRRMYLQMVKKRHVTILMLSNIYNLDEIDPITGNIIDIFALELQMWEVYDEISSLMTFNQRLETFGS